MFRARTALAARLAMRTRVVMPARSLSTNALDPLDTYKRRHNGVSDKKDIDAMLKVANSPSMDEFVKSVVPEDLLFQRPLAIEPAKGFSETELLARLKEIASKNKVLRSFIGRGYYNTLLPLVIQRNLLENPQWYTSYTPYQPEISQGRLESLINYQTLVTELTGMDVANASLLDEATAAAEAMIMSFVGLNRKKPIYYVDESVYPQTRAVLETRASGLGIQVKYGLPEDNNFEGSCGALIQYPAANGSIGEWKATADAIHAAGGTFTVAADLMALTIIEPPSTFGADIVVGTTQRFGVPMGYGGPHAAYFAVKDSVKRKLPGRIVGKSKDRLGNVAYRLALQTREQHIRREKATSNICTAQALLANISAFYAVYHGPEGLRKIAERINSLTTALAQVISEKYEVLNKSWFDTLTVSVPSADAIMTDALSKGINLYKIDDKTVSVSLDESVTTEDFAALCELFGGKAPEAVDYAVSVPCPRTSKYLQQPVFNKYHSETELLRYMTQLQSKDLSLANSMIPLGSCTMKLNATVQMVPITWPEFGNLHPFAPLDQTKGYQELITELENDLADITGFAATSLQPNSGAQGEFTGLQAIKAYLKSKGEGKRNICLIPVSAHGTNPASAAMCGMKVVPIKCTPQGELDLTDLEAKAEKHKDDLAAIMITYPSTFGVFEPTVKKAIDIVHSHGGQVYMDGANMNAQIGLTSPGDIGADVCHLNLHKTFCIPHGGGGPGVGPICVRSHLAPFLPAHHEIELPARELGQAIEAVSAAPWGSAGILPIPWAYIKLMGGAGLKSATEIALLSANYMKERLANHYKVAYVNNQGRCAHEFIIDLRPFKALGVEAIDIAKRLQDYSFHAPTMSWPVAGTLMVEPTESESLVELDRFCDAMIAIREEIKEIEDGKVAYTDSVLAHAPHNQEDLLLGEWNRVYSREKAAFPVPNLKERKFWPSVTRVDDTYGDTNLFCTCDPVEAHADLD
ncbi:Glycine dehydrogenase (decarboxylating), mitochondrial [Wickerhamiella sorbophila]|uniref:Glycine cleavage system P protein n=1 Tax=Wickerhamiella sorbophila TaxID=45607 RepID=A0A2T0FLG2_9ASCO|nr:Glycine dehydrogenase (decarboxylating), mitochondrial [Wickerhamiella sorbophila]PRT55833.1 Glycine dehydrogenase (decarboxylating), mitochondrial [Wickerhamiella sorbophila]